MSDSITNDSSKQALDQNRVILYIDQISQPCRAVIAYCLINKIPHELIDVRIFKGETRTEEFKAISPTQKVPTMIHDGFTLGESHAILTYLAAVFPVDQQWYPKDPKTRAQVDCYLHWHHGNLRHACSQYLFRKLILPKMTGETMTPELEEELLLAQRKAFSFIENILQQGLYVGRTQFPTVADISCYCEAVQLHMINFNYQLYPNVARWMQEIGEIPGVKEASKVFFKVIKKPKL